MDTLIRRYKRLLTATSTTYIRSLMDTINWDNRLIAIRGAQAWIVCISLNIHLVNWLNSFI